MWNEVPSVRILLPFLAGIVFALEIYLQNIFIEYFFWGLFLSISIFAIFRRVALQHHLMILRGILLQATLFAGGMYLVQLKTPLYYDTYFGNYLQEESIVRARVLFPAEEREKTIKLIVAVEKIYGDSTELPCFGKSLIYIKKDSLLNQQFKYGDILLLKNNFKEPEAVKNPHAFDYKKYLANQGVYYTGFFNSGDYIVTDENTAKAFWKFVFGCRLHFENLLARYVHDPDAYGVASALLLGVRSTINDDIVQAYANTGTMHILSVSGLHVGILYVILEFLLKFIPYFRTEIKNRKYAKAYLITFIIWFYAAMTGLCPSVSRSAVMFTFLIFGKLTNSNKNSYNILAASAIPLLLVNPYMVTQVGFQLSYLAIMGIVVFQKKISKLYFPKKRIMASIWSLVTVSIAAQLGTVPVTIYYFHQFPNYFLLSNILAIPVSFFVLVAGILFFSLSFIPAINFMTGWLLEFSLKVLNFVVVQTNRLPFSLTDNLYLTPYQVIIFYMVFILAAIFIFSKSKNYFIYTMLSFCALCISVGLRKYGQMQQQSTAVYSIPKSFVLTEINGLSAILYSPNYLSDTSAIFLFHIQNDLLSKGIKDCTFINIHDSLSENIFPEYFLVDTLLVYCPVDARQLPAKQLVAVDAILIDNNPVLQIEDLQNTFPNAFFIFSGSNSFRHLQLWEQYCISNHIEFHDIKKEGYFLL